MPELLDPRNVPTAGFGLPGPLQGTRRLTEDEQESRIRTLMSDFFRHSLPENDPLRLTLDDAAQDEHGAQLEAWAFHTPNLFNSIHTELTDQFGFSPGIPGDIPIDAGIAEIFNQILSTAEQRSEVERTDVEGTTFITREGTTIRERETAVDRTRFVDLPSPEEFMDDFMRGMTAFIGGQRAKGLITREAAAFFLEDPSILYTAYITDLSARVDAGEDIFRVVGADGEPIFLGEREAGAEEIRTTGIDRERILSEVIANEREQIESEVIRDLTSTGTVETTEQQQQINTEIDRRIEERTTTLINEAIQFFGTESIITTEQIFSRPELTSVLKIAPLTFLTSQFPSSSLENLAAGQRGTAQGRRETALGVNVSAPRRVGGV